MAGATGVRVVFFGSHKRPSYVVETYSIPALNDLREGETLIKVLMCTICSLDLDHIDGRREVTVPCVLGHEGIGEVIYSGQASIHPGDRVVFTNVTMCGCYCTYQQEKQECASDFSRPQSSSIKDKKLLDGCFSTHMVLKSNVSIVNVPSTVSNEVACLANCALATMVHAVNFLKICGAQNNCTAVIQGANLQGLFGCALLSRLGYKHIYCHDVDSDKLKFVTKFGGIPVLVKDYEINGNDFQCENVDVVIDVCGHWDVVPHGVSFLKYQGIYIFVGTLHAEHISSIDIDTIIKKSITVKGIHGYSASHLQEAIKFLSFSSQHFPFEILVDPPLSLQDFHNAVSKARSNQFCRTAIRPQVS